MERNSKYYFARNWDLFGLIAKIFIVLLVLVLSYRLYFDRQQEVKVSAVSITVINTADIPESPKGSVICFSLYQGRSLSCIKN